MKHRIIAVLLAVCLLGGLIPSVSAAEPTLEGSVDLDALVEHGISLFKHLEAGDKWNSVVNTTANCVGMGIMGWIGSSALQLLKWCCSAEKGGDPDYCREVLGEALYNEVVNAPVAIASTLMPSWSYWRYRNFSSAELTAARTLLGSEVGIQAQRNLARSYILTQAQHGWENNVRTEAALLYYCSAENHYGTGGVKNFMTAVRNALGMSETEIIPSLDVFHEGTRLAAAAGTVSTLNYRTKVYNFLVNTLHLDPGPGLGLVGDPAPTPTPTVPFTDMPEEGSWAYDAIVWAYFHDPQITSGTSATTFSPNDTVTRGEAMTFLWVAAGKPEPSTANNPFTDVSASAYYYKAILWAVEHNITAGTSATTFSPKSPVKREEMLTFLWAAEGRPAPITDTVPFTDVSAKKYYYDAVRWALENGMLVGNEGGDSSTLLRPKDACSRAYVVTYLYNLFQGA